jgi:tetratricopeptide (TPR) repeat protein
MAEHSKTTSLFQIPGNEQAIQDLKRIFQQHRPIAFAGAGSSAGLYPLWPQLIRRLIDEVVARGLAVETDREYWLSVVDTRPQQVVRSVKEKLGDGIYAHILREIFRPSAGLDGNFYTPVQAALMRLSFRGYVTTNYDPGLLEARLALRADSRATGYYTWRDADAVHRWFTGEIFKDEPCPILFAHGIYERSDTIVLGAVEYREAYRLGAYRRLFEKLWSEERLVFVGYGFSDPWFDVLADEVVTQTRARETTVPRHVALIGLDENEHYSPERRRLFHDQYDASVIFYRITKSDEGTEDHSELLNLLDTLAEKQTLFASTKEGKYFRGEHVTATAPQQWVHETTDDDLYVERTDALHRLNRWAEDAHVTAIAITGLGGIGKTSLVGYWLRRSGGANLRDHKGLFFWSFYSDKNVDNFMKSLLSFGTRNLSFRQTGARSISEEAIRLIRQFPVILVLDGLEVLQERPGRNDYGALLSGQLQALLEAYCRNHQGLAVLTSRFPFVNLLSYTGSSLRVLNLDRLTVEEGEILLERCGVAIEAAERVRISRRLEGHPLGLRILAAALNTQSSSEAMIFVKHLFEQSGLRADQPLERKLRHLLEFYEQILPAAHLSILSIVSLFRSPVDQNTIATIAAKLQGVSTDIEALSELDLKKELDTLCNSSLIIREHRDSRYAYSCHPVLRDQFRQSLLGRTTNVTVSIADLLAERPAGEEQTIDAAEAVVEAIQLLQDAGEFVRGDELYRGRLDDGQLLKWLPAPHLGHHCALGFVSTDERIEKCRSQLGAKRLGFYLNSVGLFSMILGELLYAEAFLVKSIEIGRAERDFESSSRRLLNLSDLLVSLGRLREAESCAKQATELARRMGRDEEESIGLSYYGYAAGLQGRVIEALNSFRSAAQIEDSHGRALESYRACQLADLLVRTGETTLARSITENNLEVCIGHNWHDDIGRCYWLLGRIEMTAGRIEDAERMLNKAENIFSRANQIQDLPSIFLAKSDIGLKAKDWNTALSYSEDALRMGAARKMLIIQCDALNLRCRTVLERMRDGTVSRADLERAGDDANAALAMSRHCNYVWAERDALHLLSEIRFTMGDISRAALFQEECSSIRTKITNESATGVKVFKSFKMIRRP